MTKYTQPGPKPEPKTWKPEKHTPADPPEEALIGMESDVLLPSGLLAPARGPFCSRPLSLPESDARPPLCRFLSALSLARNLGTQAGDRSKNKTKKTAHSVSLEHRPQSVSLNRLSTDFARLVLHHSGFKCTKTKASCFLLLLLFSIGRLAGPGIRPCEDKDSFPNPFHRIP